MNRRRIPRVEVFTDADQLRPVRKWIKPSLTRFVQIHQNWISRINRLNQYHVIIRHDINHRDAVSTTHTNLLTCPTGLIRDIHRLHNLHTVTRIQR